MQIVEEPFHRIAYSVSITIEQMAEKIMTEQLLNVMPVELQVWVGERKPATAVEVGQLADNYVQVKRTAVDPSKEARRNPNERSHSTTNK